MPHRFSMADPLKGHLLVLSKEKIWKDKHLCYLDMCGKEGLVKK